MNSIQLWYTTKILRKQIWTIPPQVPGGTQLYFKVRSTKKGNQLYIRSNRFLSRWRNFSLRSYKSNEKAFYVHVGPPTHSNWYRLRFDDCDDQNPRIAEDLGVPKSCQGAETILSAQFGDYEIFVDLEKRFATKIGDPPKVLLDFTTVRQEEEEDAIDRVYKTLNEETERLANEATARNQQPNLPEATQASVQPKKEGDNETV